MLNKIKGKFQNVGELKWVHVTGVISVIYLVFTSVGMEFSDFTSWKLLLEAFISIIKSPSLLLICLVALANQFNNTTK